ncbi:MAG TPA: hypothetical protein VNZ65_12240 [Collimonas sp.]|jgi:hypothetical protein|nr:hypothetical protein [Collimonas sp.]
MNPREAASQAACAIIANPGSAPARRRTHRTRDLFIGDYSRCQLDCFIKPHAIALHELPCHIISVMQFSSIMTGINI